MSKENNAATVWAKVDAEVEQREKIRRAEVLLLEGNLSYREYCQRREDFGKLVIEPEKKPGEMSGHDYFITRQAQERPEERTLRAGEKDFRSYLCERNTK